jgi:hypothetical protein
MRDAVEGGKDDTLDSVSIVLFEDFCDVTRSEMLAASFASYDSVKGTGDSGRENTMQCVERDVNGAVTEPSKASSGTTITSVSRDGL